MTRDDYRKAVGYFEPDEGMKRRIAEALEQQPRRRARPLRRALVGHAGRRARAGLADGA